VRWNDVSQQTITSQVCTVKFDPEKSFIQYAIFRPLQKVPLNELPNYMCAEDTVR